MKLSNIVILLQAAALVYIFSENQNLKSQIVDSGDTLSKSTRTLERALRDLNESQSKLSECRSTLDKYKYFTTVEPYLEKQSE